MNTMLKDAIIVSLARILVATLPFVTLGMLGNDIVLYVSLAVGMLALAALVVRAISLSGKRHEIVDGDSFGECVDDLLSFPYAITLSSTILALNGVDASPGFWLSAGLVPLTVFAAYRRKSGQG